MKINIREKLNLSKQMVNMLLIMGGLLGCLFVYHLIANTIMESSLEEDSDAPVTVSTIKVKYEEWQPKLNAIGNLFAARGIEVTTLLDGLIREIYVQSNQHVKKGDKLVQLNAEPDNAALEALKAEAELARLIYERGLSQFAFNAISKEALEIDKYTMLTQQALVEQQQALVDLKTIRASFDGQIGVSKLSVGQLVAEGDVLFSLQSTDLLYVYFYLPEQYLPKLKIGQAVNLRTDNYSDRTFPGKLIAIDPLIDTNTHNIQLQASIENKTAELLPGMYTHVDLVIGEPEKNLTIPQAAVSYNPYGNFVYITTTTHPDEDNEGGNHSTKSNNKHKNNHHSNKNKNKNKLFVKQRFVTLGETRGDQVVVLTGLKEGDEIVTAGQLKLRNNAAIIIDNEVQPSNDADPQVANDAV